MESKTVKTEFGDSKLDALLESLHESIRNNKNYRKESTVELIKRLRRETTHHSGV
jgi:Sec-independent protein translocase protein TatA